jgi:hypothetical protein
LLICCNWIEVKTKASEQKAVDLRCDASGDEALCTRRKNSQHELAQLVQLYTLGHGTR